MRLYDALLTIDAYWHDLRRWWCGVWGHKWYVASWRYRICWRCNARQVPVDVRRDSE